MLGVGVACARGVSPSGAVATMGPPGVTGGGSGRACWFPWLSLIHVDRLSCSLESAAGSSCLNRLPHGMQR